MIVKAIVDALEKNKKSKNNNETTLDASKHKTNVQYIWKCLKNALQQTNNSFSVKALTEPLTLELETQKGTEPSCLNAGTNNENHKSNTTFIGRILANTNMLYEALLISQFLNRYYF